MLFLPFHPYTWFLSLLIYLNSYVYRAKKLVLLAHVIAKSCSKSNCARANYLVMCLGAFTTRKRSHLKRESLIQHRFVDESVWTWSEWFDSLLCASLSCWQGDKPDVVAFGVMKISLLWKMYKQVFGVVLKVSASSPIHRKYWLFNAINPSVKLLSSSIHTQERNFHQRHQRIRYWLRSRFTAGTDAHPFSASDPKTRKKIPSKERKHKKVKLREIKCKICKSWGSLRCLSFAFSAVDHVCLTNCYFIYCILNELLHYSVNCSDSFPLQPHLWLYTSNLVCT